MKDTIFFQTKSFSEIKEIDWEVMIEWFASTKDIDRYWDIVEPKAFKEAIEHYMKTNPIMLLQHNQDKPIGKFTEAKINSKWLKVKWPITNDIDNVKQNVKDWVLKWFSIWFIVKAWKFETRNNVEVRVITDLELLEISVVAVPANPFTLFQAVKKYFTTINEKNMEDTNKIEEEILDEETIQEVVEEKDVNDSELEETEIEEVEEKTNEDDNEENKEVVEDEVEEKKDAGEAHELHNKKSSDDSENSDEITEDSKETETEETSENEEETVEDEKDWETDEEDIDLKSTVTELLEIVEKQAEIIEKQQSAIDKVGLKKGLATISTKETTDKKDSWANAWLKTFQTAKKNINY